MSALHQTLEFSDISEITTPLPAKLPRFIPMIDGSDVREWDKHLNWPAYGVGLRRVFSPTTHQLFPKFSGADVHDVLGLKSDQLAVLVGYGEDPLVEGFWTRRTSENLVQRIVDQGWDVVLAPNYSIYGNWPRAQHLISMRMSLLLAAEFAQTGVPTVPNVYWYRLEDLQRWGEWMTQYQPPAIAINLQTVRQSANWDSWALPGLHWLGTHTDVPVVITGLSRADRIEEAVEIFGARLTVVSQNPSQYALHGAVMTDHGREDIHARSEDAFVTTVRFMHGLLR